MLRIVSTFPDKVAGFWPITPLVKVAKFETWERSKSELEKSILMTSVCKIGV